MLSRKQYYDSLVTQNRLLKFMNEREVIFMDEFENWKCIRGLFIKNISFLQYCFEKFRFHDKNYNIYVSVAKYRKIPFFTMDLTKRSKYTSKWFKEDAEKEIFSYDIFLDFDKGKTRNTEIIKMLKWLKYFDLEYRIYPSGSNFQISLENSYLKYYETKKLIKNIKNTQHFKTLCINGIGNKDKIRKCEFSISNNNICLPIDNPTLAELSDYNLYKLDNNFDILNNSISINMKSNEKSNILNFYNCFVFDNKESET